MIRLFLTITVLLVLNGTVFASFKPPIEVGKTYQFVANSAMANTPYVMKLSIIEINENYVKG